MNESLKLVGKGDVALLEWDLQGEKVNKLSSGVMRRLKEVVDELEKSSYKAVVLISRKPKIFIAGADIDEIKNLKTKDEFVPVLKEAHDLINQIEDLKIPVIAAVNGACMGGGCELILACDYRIATDDKSTKIGLPETKLGIIPGFGGCIRLPRVIGLQAALDIILAGKAVDSRKAKKIGLVDEVVPMQMLEEKAIAFAKDVIAGKKAKKRKKTFKAKGLVNKVLDSAVGRGVVFKQARKMLLKQTKGFYPAPEAAIDVIKKTYGSSNRAKSIDVEIEYFCKVATTDISKYLIELFFMMEAVKKQSGVEDAKIDTVKVEQMAVLGAGVMGGGVAQVAADKGITVRMKDITNEALALGFKSARVIWEKKLKRRSLSKHDFTRKMALISGGLDYSGFKSMDVVVEAVVEDMKIKKMVIAETAKHVSENCVIATNTSSLSVNEMAEAHPNPKNFVGMHFFNPVHKMPLVEVIRGEHTSDEATARIFKLALKMGKVPVVVKDGPGFLVNRLLLPWLAEGMFLLEQGMSVGKLDRYFTHEFGMPMGPCRLIDEVGHDVSVKVLKIFKASLGDRVEMPSLAGRISETDRLGRKNSKGFYNYDERGRDQGVDDSVYADFGLKDQTDSLSSEECIQRCMFQMINEAARALYEDKIVNTPQEVDLGMIMGTGFPPFRGGLLKYADSIGAKKIVEELEVYKTKYGVRFTPSASLVEMAQSGKTFY